MGHTHTKKDIWEIKGELLILVQAVITLRPWEPTLTIHTPFPTLHPEERSVALPLGGWPPFTFLSLFFFLCSYPQPFSYLILFQDIISEHHAPAIAFFTLHLLPF